MHKFIKLAKFILMMYKKCVAAILFCAGMFILSGTAAICPGNHQDSGKQDEIAYSGNSIKKQAADQIIFSFSSGNDSRTGEESYSDNSMYAEFLPQPTPQALSIEESLSLIRDAIRPPEYPVTSNRNPLYMMNDFNTDDIDEICVLGIECDKPANARKEFLSDFSRLYSQSKESFRFSLFIFSVSGKEVRNEAKIDLGIHAVFKSMTKFSLYRDRHDPLSIAVSFHTTEGTVQKWVIFKRPELKPVTTIVLKDTFSSKVQVEDIDADGVIDIVVSDQVMEEGIGYETFLTWKKWNGSSFTDYRSVNVVRNLNKFLSRFRELSLAGKKSEIINSCLDPAEKKKYQSGGIRDDELLLEFFGLPHYSGDDSGSGIRLFRGLEDIVFPEIPDNPFYLKDEKGYYFKLAFRMVYEDGMFLIPEVLVYMLKNPFGKMQFVLMPITPAGDND